MQVIASRYLCKRIRSAGAGLAAARLLILAAACLAAASGCRSPASATAPARALPPTLAAYQARLPALEAAIPSVTRSAQASAERVLANTNALLNVPYWLQPGFAEELINRAGGLAHAFPSEERMKEATAQDVVLLAVRSWEEDGARIAEQVPAFRQRGWLVTVIASAAGRPESLACDYFIDNGAPAGSPEPGAANALANATLGWMWCCEYVAAMTRAGRVPGILISIGMEGSTEHNRALQSPRGRHWTGPCPVAVPGGDLAGQFLARVRRLMADLTADRILDQVDRAADVVAARVRAGKAAGLSGVGHLILFECQQRDLRAPWKKFLAHYRRGAFAEQLLPGDLVVWIAYVGMNSKYADYGAAIRAAGVDVVTSFAPLPAPDDPLIDAVGRGGFAWLDAGPSNALAHIDQCWALPDAEVGLPCPPGRMAPVSGLNSVLVLRMLDERVAERLEAAERDGP